MPSSIVTYTLISSDYEEPSDAGSHGVVVYGYDGLPMHPVDPYVEATLQAPGQAPPFLDYVLGLEHPPFLDYVPDLEEPEQALVSPVYVHEPEYLEMKRTLKEDPAYYPADRGNNDDDESSNDDDDDEDVEKDEEDEEDKEEEEHLAPADPSDVSTDDLVPSS
nr:hypothetical protein [Tanacetum cinerariifolium]